MNGYPQVLSEDATLDMALAGRSIARFGDGELRLCDSGFARSQKASDGIKRELRSLLARAGPALACIPNVGPTPRKKNWKAYTEPRYTRFYKLATYGSAFISRPDSAPWIDRAEYWQKVRRLWLDRHVTLVWEGGKSADLSLTPAMLKGAASVREVVGPAVNAYEQINIIEDQVGTPTGTVLLCLGAAATCLAARLAAKGVHALDVGHVGTFMPKTA